MLEGGLEPPDQSLEAAKGSRSNTVANSGPIHVAADEPGVFEHLQVLRYRGLSQGNLIHNVTTNTGIFSHQESQYLHPRRVTERLRKARELFVCCVTFDGPQISMIV